MSAEALAKYPIIFLTGLISALLLTPLWMRLAPAWGFMDQPGGRKIHRSPVPRGGGVAMFIGFHAVCAVVFLVPWKPFAGQVSIDWWYRFLVVSSMVFALGLADDRFGLRPMIKLGIQTGIGVGAYILQMRVQNVLGTSLPVWADLALTVIWFVMLMNAFNLIDGIDGLATGIALIAALGIGVSLVFRKAPGDVLLLIGFAGVCLGFLRYNFYPASVFLGDTGSLFAGFTLGALALSTNSKGTTIAGIGVPLLAVGVPLFDSLLAVWRRSIRRMMIAPGSDMALPRVSEADSDHIHHRLLRRGHGHDRVAILLYGFTLFLTVAGILASIFHDRALGIMALTLMAAAYTAFRHLAWIELRESGNVLLRGIRRPMRRNRTLLYYLAIDVVILNAAFVLSMILVDGPHGSATSSLKQMWLRTAPIGVFLPFLFLILFRAYTRVWYLARVSEYLSAGFAVIIGVLSAFAFTLITTGSDMNRHQLLIFYLLYAGMAAPVVVTARAAVRVVQDLMNWRGRISGAGGDHGPRALVYGASHRTTLFLRQQQSVESHDHTPSVEVIGLISKDDAIQGHFVHGIKVLGDLEALPALVTLHRINRIYLVEPMRDDEERVFRASMAHLPVQLIRWSISETIIESGASGEGSGRA